jgi:hypothetical protein
VALAEYLALSEAERMSASNTKRTSLVAPHMSAFGGKADMTVCSNPLSRSLLGLKRTSLFAPHMSANDPKRTSGAERKRTLLLSYFDTRPFTALARAP